jgi:hypothetical protein
MTLENLNVLDNIAVRDVGEHLADVLNVCGRQIFKQGYSVG